MMVYPIVANANGRTVAGHKSQEGALGVASAVNRFAGSELVHVGEPFESELTSGVLHVDGVAVALNPAYALAKDPFRDALNRMVGIAAQSRKRVRKATTTKGAGTAARATRATGARVKVGANA